MRPAPARSSRRRDPSPASRHVRSAAPRRRCRPGAFRVPVALAAIVLAVLAPAASARAQGSSPAELRREIVRLSDELRKAHGQLAEAQKRIAALEAERAAQEKQLLEAASIINDLRARVSSDPQAAPSQAFAPVPDDPLAAPAALLRELKARYRQEVASLPRATPDQDRAYRQAAAQWCRDVPQTLRGRSVWLVRFDRLAPAGRQEFEGFLQVLDPRALLPIGEPVRIRMPERFAARVQREKRFTLWEATLLVVAEPVYNKDRVDEGVFNVPSFVGPYVEFGYSLDWISLAGVETRTEAAPDTQEPVER